MATAKKTTSKTPASKKVDYKTLSKADLLKKSAELREEVITIKRSTKEGGVQNYRAHTQKRRELARALTALNAKAEGEEK